MRNLVLFAATGAGSGYSPVAPGTAGSAVGVLLYAALLPLPPAAFPIVLAGVTLLGTWAAARAEGIFGRKDDGRITIDEIAGMLLTLAFLPPQRPLLAVGLGFLLFRLFDILKPPPARALEALPGGVGVMADDLVAGLYANVAGQVVWRLLLPEGLA